MRSVKTSLAPTCWATICQGIRFEWCSSGVSKISSPAFRKVRPQDWATRLIDSVVPRVKTTQEESGAFRNRATSSRVVS